MKNAVWATYFHYKSKDAKLLHGMCPIGGDSWCKYKRAAARGLPCPAHNNSLPEAVMNEIKPIYSICYYLYLINYIIYIHIIYINYINKFIFYINYIYYLF